MMNEQIKTIREKIADLKSRWPAHSVPPAMLEELDDLEEELLEAIKRNKEEKGAQ